MLCACRVSVDVEKVAINPWVGDRSTLPGPAADPSPASPFSMFGTISIGMASSSDMLTLLE